MLLRGLSEKAKAGIKPKAERSRVLLPASHDTFDPRQLETLPPGFVSRVVSTQDDIPEVKRHNPGYTHLSSLLKDVCLRQIRLSDENPDKSVYQRTTGGHRVMWKIGRAIEAHVRNSYIKGVQGRGVYGNWSCKCGSTTVEASTFPANARECRTCSTPVDVYSECPLFDHTAGIVGNPDMPIIVGGLMYIVETKSMNGEDFDNLTSPLHDHIYQAGGYRRLAQLNGFEVAKEVIIHYSTKKFKYGNPYKEFHIDVTTPAITRVLDNVWQIARSIKDSRLAETLPPRTVCRTSKDTKARNCTFCVDCFNRS